MVHGWCWRRAAVPVGVSLLVNAVLACLFAHLSATTPATPAAVIEVQLEAATVTPLLVMPSMSRPVALPPVRKAPPAVVRPRPLLSRLIAALPQKLPAAEPREPETKPEPPKPAEATQPVAPPAPVERPAPVVPPAGPPSPRPAEPPREELKMPPVPERTAQPSRAAAPATPVEQVTPQPARGGEPRRGDGRGKPASPSGGRADAGDPRGNDGVSGSAPAAQIALGTGPGAAAASGAGTGPRTGAGAPGGAATTGGSGSEAQPGNGSGTGTGTGAPPGEAKGGGESRGASVKRQSRPAYPADARDDGVEGTTVLLITVDAEGRATDVKVDKGSGDRRLDRVAEREVRRWQYTPALQDGKPVPATLRVRVEFRLE